MQCPNCSGDMYDNRRTKKNPKQPDFRCKDESCMDEKGFRTGVWVEKSQNGNGGNNAPRNGNGNRNSNGAETGGSVPPLLTPAQFIAAAAKVLVSCHKVAGEAGLKDPEDARSMFISCQRAGIIETVGAKLVKPQPKPQPEPEPEPAPPADDEIPENAFADGGDSGLDL